MKTFAATSTSGCHWLAPAVATLLLAACTTQTERPAPLVTRLEAPKPAAARPPTRMPAPLPAALRETAPIEAAPAPLVQRIEASRPASAPAPRANQVHVVEFQFAAGKTRIAEVDMPKVELARRSPNGMQIKSVNIVTQANESGTPAARKKLADARARDVFNRFAMYGVPIDAMTIEYKPEPAWTAPADCRKKTRTQKTNPAPECRRPPSVVSTEIIFTYR